MQLLSDDEFLGTPARTPALSPPSDAPANSAGRVQTLTDDEFLGAPLPAASNSSSAAPQPSQGRVLSDADFLSGSLMQPAAQSVDSANRPSAISRGFVHGMFQQNPDLGAEALEALSHLAPDSLKPTLKNGSEWFKGMAQADPAYTPFGPKFRDIASVDDALTWAGETLGQGLASAVPSVVAGGTGALAGGAIAGPPGAIVGGMVGGAASSAPFNLGEVYKELKKNGVEERKASEYAILAAGPMVALDLVSVGPIVQRLGGLAEAKRELSRILAQRIAVESAKGAGREGVTEALQEVVKQATVSMAADVPFWSMDNTWDIVESGLAGSLVGGVMGGVSGVPKDRIKSPPPTAEDYARVHTDIGGAKRGGGTTSGLEPPAAGATPVNDLQSTQEAPAQPLTDEQFLAAQPVTQPKESASTGRAPDSGGMSSSMAPTQTPTPPAPTFYSQVRKIVEDKLPDSFDGEQALATIVNSPGVKAEEVQWLKLPEYLVGAGKISKRDLITHLEENAITIEDVQYGKSTFNVDWVEHPPARTVTEDGSFVEALWEAQNAPGWTIERTRNKNAIGEDNLDYEVYDPRGNLAYHTRDLETSQGWVQRHLAPPDQTQYSGWQAIKGGTNYRERLLTLPSATEPRPDGFATIEAARDYNERDRANYYSPHWSPANVLAHYRAADFTDVEGKNGMLVQEVQSDWHQAGRKHGYLNAQSEPHPIPVQERRVPDAPFKSNWAELAVKRILREAADSGYERVYFANGEAQTALYRQAGENAEGQREFYDKILPRIVEKWAKKLGGKTGRTEVVSGYRMVDESGNSYTLGDRPFTAEEAHQEWERTGAIVAPVTESVFYLDLTPTMLTNAQRGLPMFSWEAAKRGYDKDVGFVPPVSAQDYFARDGVTDLSEAFARGNIVMQSVARKLGIKRPIIMRIPPRNQNPRTYGWMQWYKNSPEGEYLGYTIDVHPSNHTDAAHLYSTIMHEFGHIVMFDKFNSADSQTQLLIRHEYDKWRNSLRADMVRTLGSVITRRDNFVMMPERSLDAAGTLINSFNTEQREYWLGFDEWFAEQIARWATTDEVPLSVVDKFFAQLGRALRKGYEIFKRGLGISAEPNRMITEFLNYLQKQQSQFEMVEVVESTLRASLRKNQRALSAAGYSDFPATPTTPETFGAANIVSSMASQMTPPQATQARATVAQADRFNFVYKWGLSVIQLAQRNPDIPTLFKYKELWQLKTLERQQIMDQALTTVKSWKKLSKEDQTALTGFIDDYMNMRFLTPQEIAAGVARLPTPNELAQLGQVHKLSKAGLDQFDLIVKDFNSMLDRYEQLLNAEAQKITDPQKRAQKLRGVAGQIQAMRSRPYFPAMRFGNYTLEIRDANNKLVEFYTFESKRQRGVVKEKLEKQLAPGEKIAVGVLPEEAGPLIGLPPGLLDLIAQKLNLGQKQRDALEVLRFELAPGHSFKHRFERKSRTPGYSQDFQRAFANYFFHGSNYLTRIKYIDQMKDQIRELRESAKTMLDKDKRVQIANFVSDHLNYAMDPKPDFSTLRAITFLWALGFSPAAAALNMSQVLIGSYPMLAAGFGDVKAVAALSKAGAQLSSYYKTAKIHAAAGPNNRDMLALSKAVHIGLVKEAMAPELAALSEGDNLKDSVGGHLKGAFAWTMEKSGIFFEATEQWNRRVTFRAAWQLATENPRAKFVQDAINQNGLQYDELKLEGWSDRDAAAFVAAKSAVEQTQYIYGQYAQPRFMRGKLRTVFIFKSFVQNTLFMLWNNPAVGLRSLAVLAVLGGMMGIPGIEDIKGLIKLIGKKFGGAQWDIDDAVREWVVNHAGGKVSPDFLLHGMSRFGFGLPFVMDAMGLPKPPTFDMSRSLSMGNILPVELDKMFNGGLHNERNMVDSIQKASGASFGMFFNFWKSLTDSQTDMASFARWQKSMPRFAQGLSRSYQAFADEQISNRQGNAVVRFDPRDTRQMMEILGMAGGFQPLRLTATWDRIIAEREAIEFWDLRRNGLLRQFWEASRANDLQERESVINSIRRFNEQLPESAKGKAITGDTIRRSIQTRSRNQALQEQGLPSQKSNIPIAQEVQRLHPEAEVDVRRVR